MRMDKKQHDTGKIDKINLACMVLFLWFPEIKQQQKSSVLSIYIIERHAALNLSIHWRYLFFFV